MTTEWTEISGGASGTFAKFTDIGDQYTGIVRDWNPTTGATTFDGDECGYVTLEDADGEHWTITLDKGALRDPINRAGNQRGLEFINGTKLQVEYSEDRESKKTGRTYKGFTVRIAPHTDKDTDGPAVKYAKRQQQRRNAELDAEAPF